jgi:hypothetical protein
VKKFLQITLAYERLCGEKRQSYGDEGKQKQQSNEEYENEFRSFFNMFNDFLVLNFAGLGIHKLPTSFDEYYEFISKLRESYVYRFWTFYKDIQYDDVVNKIEEWVVNKLADIGKQILTEILMELLGFVKYAASKMAQKLSELFLKYLN